jgi:hypothetical protein
MSIENFIKDNFFQASGTICRKRSSNLVEERQNKRVVALLGTRDVERAESTNEENLILSIEEN